MNFAAGVPGRACPKCPAPSPRGWIQISGAPLGRALVGWCRDRTPRGFRSVLGLVRQPHWSSRRYFFLSGIFSATKQGKKFGPCTDRNGENPPHMNYFLMRRRKENRTAGRLGQGAHSSAQPPGAACQVFGIVDRLAGIVEHAPHMWCSGAVIVLFAKPRPSARSIRICPPADGIWNGSTIPIRRPARRRQRQPLP